MCGKWGSGKTGGKGLSERRRDRASTVKKHELKCEINALAKACKSIIESSLLCFSRKAAAHWSTRKKSLKSNHGRLAAQAKGAAQKMSSTKMRKYMTEHNRMQCIHKLHGGRGKTRGEIKIWQRKLCCARCSRMCVVYTFTSRRESNAEFTYGVHCSVNSLRSSLCLLCQNKYEFCLWRVEGSAVL